MVARSRTVLCQRRRCGANQGEAGGRERTLYHVLHFVLLGCHCEERSDERNAVRCWWLLDCFASLANDGFSCYFPRCLSKNAGDFLESLFRFRRGIVAVIMRVRLAFIDLQRRIDAGLAQLAVNAHGVAQQEIARAAGEDRRRKAFHVAINRRQQRILQVMAVGIDLGGGIAKAIGRHQHIVQHRVGHKSVADLGHIRHRRARRDRARQRQPVLLRLQHHFQRQRAARRTAEDRDVLRVGGLDRVLVNGQAIVERRREIRFRRHPIIHRDHLEMPETRHEQRFGQRGLAGIEHVAAAMDVDQQPITILRCDHVGRQDEGPHAVDGGLLHLNMQPLHHPRNVLQGRGGAGVRDRLPLLAGFRQHIPVGASGAPMIFANCGLTVLGTGTERAGTSSVWAWAVVNTIAAHNSVAVRNFVVTAVEFPSAASSSRSLFRFLFFNARPRRCAPDAPPATPSVFNYSRTESAARSRRIAARPAAIRS